MSDHDKQTAEHAADQAPETRGAGGQTTDERHLQDVRRGEVWHRDAGPGSVKRERQPGFGGQDARACDEEADGWQDVTSDRYGARVQPETSTTETAPHTADDQNQN